MLKSLSIHNYVLIESLELDFPSGFSVITGETGAGKSILLGAIGLLIGNRADTSAIREGAAKCIIEGTFDVSALNLQAFFEDNELEYDDECIIRRELLSSGKSRAFVNDSPASLTQLKALGSRLIDIHSQHQNLLINSESFQLDVLDTIAANKRERTAFADAYQAFRTATAALRKAEAERERNSADEEFIRYQLQQFNEAGLKEGEQEELEEEQSLLEHAEEIKSGLYTFCNGIDSEENSLMNALRMGVNTLNGLSRKYAKAAEWAERLESSYIELKDVTDDMAEATERIFFDPDRMNAVNDRLSLIYSLQQKHHVQSMAELMAIENGFRERLSSIDGGEEQIAELTKAASAARQAMFAAAQDLTATRTEAGRIVEKEIVSRLVNLGMPNIRFEAAVTRRTEPEADGMDTVTFRFSANKSSSLQDISEVASGGEISRVMLAIKAITAASRQLPTIIFDEIDTGISGNIADRMGDIMKEMAANGLQIISITHLPQIAAKGGAHYRVSKTETDSGTVSSIVRLADDDRVREIAAMMSGATLTEAAINNARELLSH